MRRRRLLLLLPLLMMAVLAGCATAVTGPRAAPDGAFVVSVSGNRMFPAAIEPMEEALAEARFKCWSDRKSVSVLSRRIEDGAGARGRTATLRFHCADDAAAV